MRKMELLAPAGSMETLRGVCAAGADAVYVGGDRFGARAYAKNFSAAELLQAIDEVHFQGKKLHLTVNTLLRTDELREQLFDYLLPLYEQGLDAVIVQDLGVFDFIKKNFPGMEVHASTQMTIASSDGVRLLSELGADRIVLARELSLAEIRRIHDRVDVPLECFVHGAICYCYSGMCLFSSMLGGRSGNRGRCAQPCRLPYDVMENGSALGGEKQTYPLSPKDLCAIDLLPQLYEAGVCSLKIEGRMKQTAYAAGVTEIYRKYLDLYEAGRDASVSKEDRKRLLALGNRDGFTDGYLRGEKGRSMISLYTSSHTSDPASQEMDRQEKKRQLSGLCICRIGQPLQLEAIDLTSGIRVCVQSGEVQQAKQAPVQLEDLKKVLSQTGDTAFAFEQLEVSMDEGCFVPKQFLKKLRRNALDDLTKQLQETWRRNAPVLQQMEPGAQTKALADRDRQELLAVCDTFDQLRVCMEKDYIDLIALQLHGIPRVEFSARIRETGALLAKHGKGLLLAMPSVLRGDVADFLESQWDCIQMLRDQGLIVGFIAKNYDTLGFLRRMNVDAKQVWLDASLYTFSAYTYEGFSKLGYRFYTMPLELNERQLQKLPRAGSCLIIYGHAPFMVSSQCVNRTTSSCDGTDRTLHLVDRYGKKLPVKNYCSVCYNMIYNALPTVLYEPAAFAQVKKLSPQILRMDFTVEDEDMTRAVLAAYEQQVLGRISVVAPFDGASTRGHFKRGVE